MLGAIYYPQILSVRVHLMVLSSQKGPEDANLKLTVRFLLVKPWGQEHDFPRLQMLQGKTDGNGVQ